MSIEPVQEPAPRRATYQDVLDAPDDKIAELVDGELVLSPRPSARHSLAATEVAADLVPAFGRHRGGTGGWCFLIEPELHLRGDVLVPDVAGWRTERLPDLDAAHLTVAPDWLCEVLSPSTERFDRSRKLASYAAAGVPHIWLINPRQRTLEVLRLTAGNWLTVAVHCDYAIVHAEPFEQLALDLMHLWIDRSPVPGSFSDVAAPQYAADER